MNILKRHRALLQRQSYSDNPGIPGRILERCQVACLGGCLVYVLPSEKAPRNKYAKIGFIENGKWRMEFVHRIMCVLYNGDIPAGYEVMHECHNKRCCNPDHLKAEYAPLHRRLDKRFRQWLTIFSNRAPINTEVHVVFSERLKNGIQQYLAITDHAQEIKNLDVANEITPKLPFYFNLKNYDIQGMLCDAENDH